MLMLLQQGAMPTTTQRALVQTTAVLKTLLQVLGKIDLRVVEWGISFPATAEAAKPSVSLLTTGTIAATVSASAEADISKFGAAAQLAADYLTLSTTGTGYNASAEGTITASAALDPLIQLSPTGLFVKRIPLEQEAIIYKGDIGRIRVLSAVDYAVGCWMFLKPA